jgi:hypothetical protein
MAATNERKLYQKVFELYLIDQADRANPGLTITTETIRGAFGNEVFTAMFGDDGSAVLDEKNDLDQRKFKTCYKVLQKNWTAFAKVTSSVPAGPGDTMVMGSEPALPDMTLTQMLDWAGMRGMLNPPTEPMAEGLGDVDEDLSQHLKSDPDAESKPEEPKSNYGLVRMVVMGAIMILGGFFWFRYATKEHEAGKAKQATTASAPVTSAAAPVSTAAEAPAPIAAAAPTIVAETPAPSVSAEVPAPIAKPVGPEEITVTCENRRLPQNCRITPTAPASIGSCYQESFMPTEPLRLVCPNGLVYSSKSNAERIAPGEAVEVALYLQQ